MYESLTSKLLENTSPYISSMIYDIDGRKLILECVNNPEDCIPKTRVIFSGIKSYSEENIDEEFDDLCMDSVIDFSRREDNVYIINTEKKEISVEVDSEPVSESIA